VRFGALTSSPEWPRRPLPVPAADEARSPPRPPCHVRTRLRYEMHQLVDQMMAGSTVQGRRRRASAARRRSPANPAATPACVRPGSLDHWFTTLIKTRGYRFGAVHRGPVRRVHGAVHHIRARLQPLDLRSTVRLWHFLLRAPEQLYFRMTVLPPYKNLAYRSWFLQSSPCLPWLIVLEVLFLSFSTLALLFYMKLCFSPGFIYKGSVKFSFIIDRSL
jgi:hypothetical protein